MDSNFSADILKDRAHSQGEDGSSLSQCCTACVHISTNVCSLRSCGPRSYPSRARGYQYHAASAEALLWTGCRASWQQLAPEAAFRQVQPDPTLRRATAPVHSAAVGSSASANHGFRFWLHLMPWLHPDQLTAAGLERIARTTPAATCAASRPLRTRCPGAPAASAIPLTPSEPHEQAGVEPAVQCLFMR